MFLLAQFREKQAYPKLMRLLKIDRHTLDWLLEDILTEDLYTIICSVFDGDLDSLKRVIEDPKANFYARSAAIKAYTVLFLNGSIKDDVTAYCRELINTIMPNNSGYLFASIAIAVKKMNLRELLPDMKKLYDQGAIDLFMTGNFSQYSEHWSDVAEPEIDSYLEDAIKSLERWSCFTDSDCYLPDGDDDNNNNNTDAIGVLGIRFQSINHDFEIAVWPCLNPDCTCSNVTLRFCEIGTALEQEHFRIVVNSQSFKLISSMLNDSEYDYPKVIHEFLTELSDEEKANINNWNSAERKTMTALRPVSGSHFYDNGTMVWFGEVFKIDMLQELSFYADGKKYAVYDQYCINPDCDCRNVWVSLFEYKKTKQKEKLVLKYNIDFDSDEITILDNPKKISRKQQSDLLDGMDYICGCEPHQVFKYRYKQIKKWASQNRDYLIEEGDEEIRDPFFDTFALPETAKAVREFSKHQSGTPKKQIKTDKIGRNDPCPCGSGKKYNKCCGKDI
jgi:hypothetical protein